MQFTKKIRLKGNSLSVTIPSEIVDGYKLNPGDLITFDLVEVHREAIKSA